MARHAGFAVAVSVAQDYINQTLWAAIDDQQPLSASRLFQLPTSIPLVGGGTARLSGLALFESRPTITLQTNPGNTVRLDVTAIAYLAVNTNVAAPIDQDQTWKVRLSASVEVLIDVDVDPAGLFLRWQPGGSAVDNITLTVLEGPGIPSFVVNAINSPQTHNVMTQAVHALGPMRISTSCSLARFGACSPVASRPPASRCSSGSSSTSGSPAR
jgi:hypothetical protein